MTPVSKSKELKFLPELSVLAGPKLILKNIRTLKTIGKYIYKSANIISFISKLMELTNNHNHCSTVFKTLK